jgi:uncharacterized protein (DUF169 family)
MTTTPPQASRDLVDLLGLTVRPMGIQFVAEPPQDVPRFEGQIPPPGADGRTGKVPAGCVFWMHGTERTFSTLPEDHGNCSVGSYTHGLLSLEQAAGKEDVQTLLEAGWVTEQAVGQVPAVQERPGAIVYGPLDQADTMPDVVFLRVNGKQAMMLKDAWPDMRMEGKPQCHIVPIAKEQQQVALSVGCMLSRVRTGMSNR